MLSTGRSEESLPQSIIPENLESKGKNYNSLNRLIVLGKSAKKNVSCTNALLRKRKCLYCGQESLTLQSFVIVQRNLAEYRRETNLPATSAQTDKQAWIQSAHGLEKREKSAVPSQVEGAPPAHRKRREVSSTESSETTPAIVKETRDPPRVSNIFTRYYGGTVSSKRPCPLFLCNNTRAQGDVAGWIFCQPERAKCRGSQPRSAVDERNLPEE